MDISQFLTVAGGGAVIVALVEAIKRALKWDQEQTVRFAPLLAIVLGIVITVVGTLALPIDPLVGLLASIFGAVLQGIVTGATAVGIYNLGAKEVIVQVAGPSGEV